MNNGHTDDTLRLDMRKALIAQAIATAFAVALPAPALAADGESGVDRANVSSTPTLASNKAKIAQLTQYSQARKSDGTAILPVAGKCTVTTSSGAIVEIGVVRSGKCQVQPQVVTYFDEIAGTLAQDTWAAVSLDDGQTWRRTNLSHSADKDVSIEGVTLTVTKGDTAKPALSTAGRNMFVAWTGKYCPSGNPSGFLEGKPGTGYLDDLHQVAGPQGYVDYAAVYDRPDLGVVPFSCVSAARGYVDQFGNIVWSKAEQLTSGRRDAYQLTTAVAGEVGFAAMWQEDPFGLNPGSAAGPGDGMSGAVVNRKTDIWYNHVLWGDFLKGLPTYTAYVPIEPSTPPEDPPTGGRPEATMPMSSPVRVSDNAACKVDVADDGTRTHYGAGYCKLPEYCTSISPVDVNGNRFCVTNAGIVLDGNTGASRPNLFLQKVTYSVGYPPTSYTTAEAIVGYEETKGMGSGPDQDILDEDLGKNVIYHHFADFSMPKVIDPGKILNTQEVDDKGNLLYTEDGKPVYGNARRVRFILQPKGNKGASGTVMLAVYKEGAEGKGRASDIMMRRWVNGYAVGNLVCDNPLSVRDATGKKVDVCAGINLSTAQPQEIQADTSGGTPKVITWKWDAKNLLDGSEANPYEDARAHRGFIKGDFIGFGYTWTPNWAAARNGNDVYDYYIRRSFDGGRTWTNLQGQFQDPVNVSNLRLTHSNGITAIEPRLVGTPSTILASGSPTGIPDDVQNPMVFFTSFGTSSNPDLNLQYEDDDEDVEAAAPLDLYWSWTDNWGESYKLVPRIASGTGETVYEFDWLAKNDAVHEGEAQLRMSPAGTSLSAAWLGETMFDQTAGACIPGQVAGSDICYRRITGLKPLARYDVNNNGVLDLDDWKLLNAAFGKTDATSLAIYDFNADREINKLEDGRLWLDACKVFVAQYPSSGLVCPTK